MLLRSLIFQQMESHVCIRPRSLKEESPQNIGVTSLQDSLLVVVTKDGEELKSL